MDEDTPVTIGELTYYWVGGLGAPHSMYLYPVLYRWEDYVVHWCDEYIDDEIMFCRHHKSTDICTQLSTMRRFDKHQNIWICRMYER